MGEEAVKSEPQNAQQDTKPDNTDGSGGGGGGQGGPGGNQGGGGAGGPRANQGGGQGGGGGRGGGRGGPGGGGGGGRGGQGNKNRGGQGGGSRFSGGRGGGQGGRGQGGGQGGPGGGGQGGQGGGPGGQGNMGMGSMGGMGNMNSTMNDMQMKMSESMMEGLMDESMMGIDGRGAGGGRGGRAAGGGGGGRGGGGNRGGNRGPGGGGGGGGNQHDKSMQQMRGQEDRLMKSVMSIAGPTHDLPPQDLTERKFAGRNRLYVGNLTNDTTEEDLQELFAPYGETSEYFLNKEKNFAFLRLDFHASAERAKRELDGTVRKGRVLKVRFAPHSTILKVKNLTPWVSNELLALAFGVFGEIERAIVITDDRGKSTGEGIVEYSRKPYAQMALRKCSEGCYFLTSSLRPVIVELHEPNDDTDGYPDKNLPKKNPEFFKAREYGPRFASPGSFEHEYGTRWKQLHELYKQKEESLKREMAMEEDKLEAQMEFARSEHETELLREQLRIREADRERQKREWEMKERQVEEQRLREEELRRRQQEEMSIRIRRQEEELHRRQQENNMFMQEQAMRTGMGGGKSFDNIPPERDGYPAVDGNNLPVDPKSFMDQYNNMERNNRGGYNDERGQIMDLMDMRVDMGNMGNMGNMGGNRGAAGGGRWQGGNERPRPDDFPNKRRRY